jgi:hypothetical protein
MLAQDLGHLCLGKLRDVKWTTQVAAVTVFVLPPQFATTVSHG